MFDLYSEITKLELVMQKEIEVYNSLLEYEEKKIMSIIDTKLQDINLYCDYQHKKMKEAVELSTLRETIVEKIVLNKFPHLTETATISDLVKRIPIAGTSKISSMRLELTTLIAKLKNLNKLAPKLFEEALDLFSTMKNILNETKKIGYDNKGREHTLNKKMSLLVNKQV